MKRPGWSTRLTEEQHAILEHVAQAYGVQKIDALGWAVNMLGNYYCQHRKLPETAQRPKRRLILRDPLPVAQSRVHQGNSERNRKGADAPA